MKLVPCIEKREEKKFYDMKFDFWFIFHKQEIRLEKYKTSTKYEIFSNRTKSHPNLNKKIVHSFSEALQLFI